MSKPITPLLTVDAVILANNENDVVLIRRKYPPFQNMLALPGGFVNLKEKVEDACIREAYEETNLNISIINLIGVFSDPERDPRGHTVSIAYLCKPKTKNEKPRAKDDAAALEIVPLTKIPFLKLAFDHLEIIKASGILNSFNR